MSKSAISAQKSPWVMQLQSPNGLAANETKGSVIKSSVRLSATQEAFWNKYENLKRDRTQNGVPVSGMSSAEPIKPPQPLNIRQPDRRFSNVEKK